MRRFVPLRIAAVFLAVLVGVGSTLLEPAATVARTQPPPAPTGPASQQAPLTEAPHAETETANSPRGPELVELRTESSRTFDNGDGTFTTEAYSAPVFYRPTPDAPFEPISLGFEPLAERAGWIASRRAPVEVQAGPADARGEFLSVRKGDRRIGFRLPAPLRGGNAASVAVDRARADLGRLLPGADLRVFAGAHGAKSFLVLDRAPVTSTFIFEVDAPGLTLVAQPDGSAVFRDVSGGTAATIPAPYVLDSTPDERRGGGRYSAAAVRLLVGAGSPQTITLAVDPAWLATATYPVYVDPSVTWVLGDQDSDYVYDAHVAEQWPDTNYADYTRPSAPGYHELWLGSDPTDLSDNQAYLRFSFGGLQLAAIDSATLDFFPYHQYYNAPTSTVTYIDKVIGDWTETNITWNNSRPTTGALGLAYTSVGQVDTVEGQQTPLIPITSVVQGWVNDPATNDGLRLREPLDDGTHWKRLIASEERDPMDATRPHPDVPRMVVTWHRPTATNLNPTASKWTNSRRLDWTFQGSAAGDSQTAFEVEVATDSVYTSLIANPPGVTGSAGANTFWDIPTTTALTVGSTYYWRVRVKDAVGWSLWANGSFRWDDVADLANFTAPEEGTTNIQNETSYTVSWTEPTGGSGIATRSLTRQRVAVATPGSCPTTGWIDRATESTPSPVTVTGFLNGHCYRWLQELTDNAGNSWTSTSGTVIVDTEPPMIQWREPPIGSTVVTRSTSTTISWDEIEVGSGVSSQHRTRERGTVLTAGTCSDVVWASDGTAVGPSPASPTSLSPGYCYRWSVTVIDNAGNAWTEISGSVLVLDSDTAEYLVSFTQRLPIRDLINGGAADPMTTLSGTSVRRVAGLVAFAHSYRGATTDWVGGYFVDPNLSREANVTKFEQQYDQGITARLEYARAARAAAPPEDVAGWDAAIADMEGQRAEFEAHGILVHGYSIVMPPERVTDLATSTSLIRRLDAYGETYSEPQLTWEQ